MSPNSSEDLLDRLVAEYSDRLARGGDPPVADILSQVADEHREALERCLRMIKAGLASAPRVAAALVPGTVLGDFRIVRELGRGGMSIVFLAEQRELARPVALKVLRPGLAVEAQHVERFKREALSIARLQHPHIVQIFAVGETDGWHWLAMEYVDGPNLAQVFQALQREDSDPRAWTPEHLARAAGARAVPPGARSYAAALCALLAPVARAVGVAHEIGLVHRDIKPSNILVRKDGRALVADFGLAKGDGDPGLSLTGEPIGTPYYMSPEQATLAGNKVDRRTDVYSLGVTLYEGLSARRPFEGTSPLAVLDAIRTAMPAALRATLPKIDREVESTVEVAMASAREERYANAFDLAHDLDAIARGEPTRAAARRGGEWARFRRALALARTGRGIEYKSRGGLWGLPWVHLHQGRREPGQGPRVARGWIACGEIARGGIALGGMAQGVFAFGGVALGGVTFGGVNVGLVPCGGMALGVMALGGVAAGWIAWGGLVFGHYAVGGVAYGAHVVTESVKDPVALEFLERYAPWMLHALHVTVRG